MPFQQRGMVTGCKPSWRGSVWFALEFRRGNTSAVGPPIWDKEVRAGLLREIRVVPRKSVAFRPVAAGGKAFLFGRKQYEGTTGKSETGRSGCLSGCQRDGGPGKHPGEVLGEKGELTALLKQMGKLSAEERPIIGQLANEIREKLTNEIESQKKKLEEVKLEAQMQAEAVDVTIPGRKQKLGHQHPMYIALDEIKDIFVGMGFTILDGPEVELAYYNFDRLNAEEGHPSRDWSDTFYFDKDSRVMLRSQTSPMQVHAMETMELPIRILAPGRVYRKDEVDATHSPMFHQVEGMVIDKNITMADLKGTLNAVMEQLYGKGTKTRFRPHHFPFTEPSCEVDIQCHKCGGVGCPTCKGEGWIEVLGAGMVHPKVLRGCGVDPDVYSGYAFGMGLERLAMGQFKISDLRLIFENDIRFLEQF